MNVERRAAVVLAPELEYEHQLLIVRRRLPQRLRRGRRARRWWVRPCLKMDELLDLPPSLSISGVGSFAGGFEVTNTPAIFSLFHSFHVCFTPPLPVYLGFLDISVIGQKCAVLRNLFAANDLKWKLNLLLYQLRQDRIWNVTGLQLFPFL